MPQTILGTRIRESRRQQGVTQAELARRIGISASYLNLIERNKRRIAGPLLKKTADALGLRAEELDGAAERRLIESLNELAHQPLLSGLGVEVGQTGDLIGRYPGWSRALSTLARSERAAQNTARDLSDRLAHDPFLQETIHGMLTRIAAIRSAAEILTEYADIPADQRSKFDAIVHEEAAALTDVGEALAAYFDKAEDVEGPLTPVDEVEAMFDAQANHFGHIETSVADRLESHAQPLTLPNAVTEARALFSEKIDAVIAENEAIETGAAKRKATSALLDYTAEALLMPLKEFSEAAIDLRYDIDLLRSQFKAPVDAICRRLTALPPDAEHPRFGYLQANAAGTLTDMRGLDALVVPRYAAACPLWILFRAQQQPEAVHRQRVVFPDGARFVFVARARATNHAGFNQARHFVTDMVMCSEQDAALTAYAPDATTPVDEVGPACPLCPRTACVQRVDTPLGV